MTLDPKVRTHSKVQQLAFWGCRSHLDAPGVGDEHGGGGRHARYEEDAEGEVDIPHKHAERVE